MAYTSNFTTLDGDSVKIEIYGAGDGELTLSGSSPVLISYESDDIFKPLKQSSCTISVVSDEPILSLYTGKLNDITCSVFVKNHNSSDYKLLWHGFLTPNVYSQNYNQGYNKFNLEFIDAIAQTEYVRFNQGGTTTTTSTSGSWWDGTKWNAGEPPEGFVKQPNILQPGWNWLPGFTVTVSTLQHFNTFFTYICDSIKCVDVDKVIKYIAVQDDVLINIKECGCLSRNFIDESGDEKDGSMTYKEILESLLSYMSASMVYYGDTLYIVNPLSLERASFTINPIYEDGTTPEISLDTRVKNLTDIGVLKASANISLGDIFNKITLRANNNPISSTIPDPFNEDDLETIVTFNGEQYIIDKYKYLDDQGWHNYNLLCNFSKNKRFSNPLTMFDELFINEPKYRTLNAVIERYTDYTTDEPEPSSLEWNTCVTWQIQHLMYDIYTYPSISTWSIMPLHYTTQGSEGTNYFIGKDGYLIIDFKYKFSENNATKENSHHNYVQPGTDDWYRSPDPYGHPHSSVKHNPMDFNWGVGKSNGNENQATWRSFKSRYPNNVLDNKIIETHRVDLIIGNKAWNGSQWVNYDFSTYAGFQVTSTLTYDDAIFGRERHIDNNVSYTLHLAEPLDGVIIPLPTGEVLQGDLTFKVYPSNFFGVQFGSANGGVPNNIIAYSRYATVAAEFITDLKVIYTTNTGVKNIFNLDTYDPDIVYTNVINEDFVTEFDDLELTTNTYTPYTTSTSFVMTQDASGNKRYVEQIAGMKQEERIVSKYANYYSQPKLIYNNNLHNQYNTVINPFTMIFINSLNKKLVVDSLTLDLADNQANVNLKEV